MKLVKHSYEKELNYLLKHYLEPSEEEKKVLKKIVNEFKKKLEELLEEEVFIGGSYAKNTYLKGKNDVDVFIRFKEEKRMRVLEEKLSVFKNLQVVRGSRTYYRINFKKILFEVVPILKIKSANDFKNITDVSPFHVDFVNKHLTRKQKNEVRLLKAFCKANNLYGAETSVHGFSGYVLELLIAYYGSFLNVLKAISEAKPPLIISFNKSKPINVSVITLIDPVQSKRNASKSVSGEKFSKLQFLAKKFLLDLKYNKSIMKYFKPKKMTIKKLQSLSNKRGTKLFVKKIRIEGDSEKFLSKLNKKLKNIKSRIEAEGYSVYDYAYFLNKNEVIIYFEIETLKLSRMKKHYGPPVSVDLKHFEEFIKKWGENKVYVSENHLCVDVRREELDVLINSLFKNYLT